MATLLLDIPRTLGHVHLEEVAGSGEDPRFGESVDVVALALASLLPERLLDADNLLASRFGALLDL